MSERVQEQLNDLRKQLCLNSSAFCRACFEGGPHAASQNPPNVFRNRMDDTRPYCFFVFDKPNNNDPNRGLGLEPIEVLDDRFPGNPTRANTIKLLEILQLDEGFGTDSLCSPRIHITNAIKCDKCAMTGKSGQIEIGEAQAEMCQKRFFFRELEILQPKVLVLFGAHTDKFVTGETGPTWKVRQELVNGNTYAVVRVPHTTATPFNTHGKKGLAYRDKLAELWDEARMG